MSTKLTLTVLLVAITLAAFVQPAYAYDGPTSRGTAIAHGDRAHSVVLAEHVRLAKTHEVSYPYYFVWEDGSWALDTDGIFPYDVTGCYDWGICD